MAQVLYHGSTQIVREPEIRAGRFTKDFGVGFYCTLMKPQAVRWATRFAPARGYVNMFLYEENPALRLKRFDMMTEEWLDFIAACRAGKPHDYDVVEGPMADDTIFTYVQDFLNGVITRKAFWALAEFKHPTHQICFCTDAALESLTFQEVEVYD